MLCCGYTLTDFPYPSGLLHWHCGNLTIAPVPAKQPWWIWINTSCELIMNDCVTTTKQSTTKPCVYFLGYTVTGKISQGHQCVCYCHQIAIIPSPMWQSSTITIESCCHSCRLIATILYTAFIKNTIRDKMSVAGSGDTVEITCNGMLDQYFSQGIKQYYCCANRPFNLSFMCHTLAP